MPSIPEPPAKVFQLRAVTRRLKDLLVEVEAKRFWVRAQCVPESGGRLSTGHFYCSLVDNDDRGKPAARMRAVIWRTDRERIERKLQQAGQQQALAVALLPEQPPVGLVSVTHNFTPAGRRRGG